MIPISYVSGKDPIAEIGGHSSYVRAHARAAIRAGYEPHLFCVAERSSVVETDFGVVHRTASPFRPFRAVLIPLHAPLVVRPLIDFVRQQKGKQVIHGFGPWGWNGLKVASALREKKQVACLVNIYTTMEHEAASKVRGMRRSLGLSQMFVLPIEYIWFMTVVGHFEKRTYRESTVVACNYESVRRMHVERWGPRTDFRNLPYASEAAFFEDVLVEKRVLPGGIERLQPAASPLIVAVSRQDARKGIDILLHALARLRGRGIPFRAALVGGGLLQEPHRRLASKLGLDGSVVLEGRVPDSYAYLQHADIFVLPSIQEGSGSVSLLEALQAGTAVVASDIDGIPEDVVHEESALLFRAGDVSDLADALQRVLVDADLRARLKQKARAIFEQRFSAERLTTVLAELYEELGHGR